MPASWFQLAGPCLLCVTALACQRLSSPALTHEAPPVNLRPLPGWAVFLRTPEQAMRDQQARELVQKRDLAAGINAEARAAEEALKAASTRLAAGMTPAQVITLLGQPESVQAFTTIEGIKQLTGIPLAIQATANSETYYTYFPFRAVRGDDRHGLSWQVLIVQFDEQRQVAKWLWETPIIWSPSMKFTSTPPGGRAQ